MKPIYSMTGYGQALVQLPGGGRVHVELRGVNSRFLDLVFRLPDELRGAEPAMRQELTRQLRRGKVECRGSVEREQSPTQWPDAAAAAPLLAAEAALRAAAPHLQPLSVADVFRLLAGTGDAADSSEALHAAATAALSEAATQFIAARAAEGERLRQLLLDRIEAIAGHAERARALVPQVVTRQQERFLARWEEAMRMADGFEAEAQSVQERRLQEAAAFALRIDIAEELDRLQAHLASLRQLLQGGGELGKRLDFLIQELHREANTLGSKSAALELSEIALELKVLIEQMREQVQNIE